MSDDPGQALAFAADRRAASGLAVAAEVGPGPSPIRRIVVINDFSVPEGGAGTLAALAIAEYRRRGFPVTLLTGQGSTPALEALGVEVVGLGSRALLQLPPGEALRQGYHNAAAERLVAEWIARHDGPGTVYHLHNWSQMLSPAVFRALAPVAGRTAVTCHDFFNVCPNGGLLHFGRSEPCDRTPLSARCVLSRCDRRSYPHKLWRVARHWHLLRLARFAERDFAFTFIHSAMRDAFVARGFAGRGLVTIPNPVVPWSEERIRAETNSGFLFVGRIGRDKGADLAAAAAHDAGQTLTLVGTGELETELTASYPQVRLAGWCDRDAIAAHAKAARALIVPSRVVEPFGLVILEAARSGLPVIVSDRAYLAEDVGAEGMGEVFSTSDRSGLAAMLSRLAGDDDAVRRMSVRAHERAAAYCHTAATWSDAFVKLFEERLELARSRP